jgi:predicted transcriptional regulator
MASDPRLTLSTQQKIAQLAKTSGAVSRYLSDNLRAKFGSSRLSDVIAKIGNTKEPKEKIFNDHIRSL